MLDLGWLQLPSDHDYLLLSCRMHWSAEHQPEADAAAHELAKPTKLLVRIYAVRGAIRKHVFNLFIQEANTVIQHL